VRPELHSIFWSIGIFPNLFLRAGVPQRYGRLFKSTNSDRIGIPDYIFTARVFLNVDADAANPVGTLVAMAVASEREPASVMPRDTVRNCSAGA
jgi:hypothetical protein